MREIASFDGLMIVHAEDTHAIEHAPTAHGETYTNFLSSRPRGAENLAIAQVIELARWTGCRVHILHVSSSDALPMIATARRDGIGITAETCPHYLTFASEEIPDGATQYKCCPPIREGGNRELLWRGLGDGVIDLVVSDHSPSTVDLKCLDIGDFGVAWGGISSLQLGLSAVWTQARQRGLRPGRRLPMDVSGTGEADRPAQEGPYRHWIRRRLLRFRARRRVRGRRAPPAPQERDHPV